MTPYEIGSVYNELRDCRVLFSEARRDRRRTDGQRHAVDILKKAAGRFKELDSFLDSQGMRLVVKETASLGLPGDGLIYILVRDVTLSAPAHVAPNQIVSTLLSDKRNAETVEQMTIWSTFLTLTLLYFLYTRAGRPMEAVSSFREAFLDFDEFLQEVHKRVEALAEGECEDNSRRQSIRDALTSLGHSRLDGRCRAFLNTMVSLGILMAVESVTDEHGTPREAWQQTLWSAVDIAENFHRYGTHLLVEDVAEQLQGFGEGEDLFLNVGEGQMAETEAYGDPEEG